MGGCVAANSKVIKKGTEKKTDPDTSRLKVRESHISNIFGSMSSPVDNIKIVKKCEELASMFDTANVETYKNCEWRKLSNN